MSSSSSVTSSDGPPFAGWGPDPAPSWVFWAVSTVVTIGATVALYALVSQGAIMNDDIAHLRFAQESGFTLDYLFTPVFDHFSPGHRLLVYLHLLVGPMRFDLMFALISVMVGASGLVATHLLTRLYGAHWWVPLVTVLIVLNPFTVDVTAWFASAYHQVPALFLGLLAVDAFVNHRLTERPEWLMVSVAAISLGMLFVSKILLFVGVIVMTDHLLLRGETLRQFPRSLVRSWPLWMVYAVPTLIYLALAAQTIEERPIGSPADIVAGSRLVWLARFVPTLFGLHVEAAPDGSLAGAALAVAMLAQLLLVLLVVLLLQRRPSSGRVVFVLLVVFAVNAVMTLTTRVSVFGPAVGLPLYRYWLEPFVVACVLVPWGFARADRALSPWRWRLTAGVAVALLALSLGGNVHRSWTRHAESQNVAAGRWFEEAQRSVAAMERREIPVVDDRMPEALLPAWIAHGAPVSQLEPLANRLAFTGDPEGFIFSESGSLVPVDMQPWFRARGTDLPSNTLITIQGETEADGPALCFEQPVRLEILLGPPDEPQFVKVTTDGAARVQHRALVGGQLTDPPPDAEAAIPASGDVILPLSLSPADAHAVTLEPTAGRACLERLQIGPIAGAPPLVRDPGTA